MNKYNISIGQDPFDLNQIIEFLSKIFGPNYYKANVIKKYIIDQELKIKFLEIKAMKPGEYQNPFPKNSPLIDLYRDGKAIDRFQDLLCANS